MPGASGPPLVTGVSVHLPQAGVHNAASESLPDDGIVAFQPPAIPQFYSLPCSLDYRKRANSPGWLQSATKFLLSHNLGWLQPASFFIVFWIACMVKNITISIFRTKLPTSLDLYRWLFQQWSISNSILHDYLLNYSIWYIYTLEPPKQLRASVYTPVPLASTLP